MNSVAGGPDALEELRGLAGDQPLALADDHEIVRHAVPNREKGLD